NTTNTDCENDKKEQPGPGGHSTGRMFNRGSRVVKDAVLCGQCTRICGDASTMPEGTDLPPSLLAHHSTPPRGALRCEATPHPRAAVGHSGPRCHPQGVTLPRAGRLPAWQRPPFIGEEVKREHVSESAFERIGPGQAANFR